MKTFSFFTKCILLVTVLILATALQAGAANVYVLGAGDAGEDTRVKSVLESFGHSVTIGQVYSSFTGSVSLTPYNAVLLMPNYSWSADMPTTGQSALLNYVSGGGGLVTTEWTIWGAETGRLGTLAPALPATSGGAYTYATPTTYFRNVADPIIDYNLLHAYSYIFTLTNLSGTESRLTPKSGATTWFTTSYGGVSDTGYAGVVGWTYGSGRVISLSTLAAENELANADYRQLFSNTVTWVAGESVPVPIPGALWLLAPGLAGLAAVRRRFTR